MIELEHGVKSLIRVQLFVTHELQPLRLLLTWGFPGKNTGVGCHFLLQGIFLTQNHLKKSNESQGWVTTLSSGLEQYRKEEINVGAESSISNSLFLVLWFYFLDTMPFSPFLE